MTWRTDEPPKDKQILAAVEEVRYHGGWGFDFTPVKYVAPVGWYSRHPGYWALDDETQEYPPSEVLFTKWTPFPEYPQ